MIPHHRRRIFWQAGFFILFVLAPVFDLLRYDLVAGHAWFLTLPWHVGFDDYAAGRIGMDQLAYQVLLRVFLPILAAGILLIGVAWRWGRLYCGWLCPHFSVVETLNALMQRAIGKPSLWDRQASAPGRPWWWLVLLPLSVAFAFLWAVALLTYLLPPAEVYGNLWAGRLTPNQARFIGVGTLVLTLEFLFARHLFCRYACAVGLFQSLAWMGNRRAMVVGFARPRASQCEGCRVACNDVCPMRLKPRSLKRHMFTCTQCGQCLEACATVQRGNPQGSLLTWIDGEAARANEARFSAARRED